MLNTLYGSLKISTMIWHKYKDSHLVVDLENALLAKSNIKLIKVAIRKQIEADQYWWETYEKPWLETQERKSREYFG